MDYEKKYKEALERAKKLTSDMTTLQKIREFIFPELCESEDERINKAIFKALSKKEARDVLLAEGVQVSEALAYLEKQKDASKAIEAVDRIDKYIDEHLANAHDMKDSNPDKKYYRGWDDALGKMAGILQDVYSGEKQKPIKMEVYEAGKSTTICGQDYKCKKDYKEGNCRYIKDAIYHCSRDGYLNDQNGASWSCTPEWFNEYIYTNNELADKEKNDFVSGQFLQCKLSFEGFKEGEHYWLEYVGDDMYVGRSDNILNQKFHITPRQLFTLFSQQLEEVQGPPQGEKQVSLNYEPPFNENPSDNEIIEALIKHLKEQDGFLTAINCVSTKAILGWLKKQKEQKPAEWSEEDKMHLSWIIECFDSWKYQVPEFADHYQSAIDWLKSLRPQYHGDVTMTEAYKIGFEAGKASSWKPSEEQMENLKMCYTPSGVMPDFSVLESLYDDLEKLM